MTDEGWGGRETTLHAGALEPVAPGSLLHLLGSVAESPKPECGTAESGLED